MRSTCEKYSRINVSYKYRKTVNDLLRNKDIVIMKQEKERGVVVMNRGKYFGKCLAILNTEQSIIDQSCTSRIKFLPSQYTVHF